MWFPSPNEQETSQPFTCCIERSFSISTGTDVDWSVAIFICWVIYKERRFPLLVRIVSFRRQADGDGVKNRVRHVVCWPTKTSTSFDVIVDRGDMKFVSQVNPSGAERDDKLLEYEDQLIPNSPYRVQREYKELCAQLASPRHIMNRIRKYCLKHMLKASHIHLLQ